MIPSGEHAGLLRRTTWRPEVLVLGKVAVVATTAVVLCLLLRAGWLPALAAAGVVTLAICAVTAPRAFRIAAYVGVVMLPFVTAWSALRPGDINYTLYVAAFLLALVGLGALQPRMFTAGTGTLYLAYVAVAATIAVVATYGGEHAGDLACVLAGFAVYTLVRRSDAPERRLLIALVISLGVAQSILAVMQALFGWPVFAAVLPALMQSDRNYFAFLLPGMSSLVTQGSGTFAHFNALGALLSLCLPLTFGIWLNQRRSPWRLASLALTTAGVIATFSRGALLGALAGVLLALWCGPTRSRRATILLLGCFTALVCLLGMNIAAQYFETTQNLTIRVETWHAAIDDALAQPSNLIAGYGFGYFHDQVLAAGRGGSALTQQSNYMASLHSGYVQLALEFGIVGAVLFGAWMFRFFRQLRNAVSPVLVPALAGALGFLCSQALDNALFSYAGVLLVALLAIAEAESDDASQERRGR